NVKENGWWDLCRKWSFINILKDNGNLLSCFHELSILDNLLVQINLGKIIVVHKVEAVIVFVQILEFTGDHFYFVDLMTCRKSVFKNFTVGYGLHFSPYESGSFSWFNVQKFNDLENIITELNTHSFFNIVACCH